MAETDLQRRARLAMEAKYPNFYAGPQQSTLVPNAVEGSQQELDAYIQQKAMEAPSGSLATDPNVLSSYQKMMSYGNQADMDTADLRRKLVDSIASSQKARNQSMLNAHTGFSDRGILNSGIALGQDANINTAYDT